MIYTTKKVLKGYMRALGYGDGDYIYINEFPITVYMSEASEHQTLTNKTLRAMNDKWIPDYPKQCGYCESRKVAPSSKTCANCGAAR